MHQPRDHVRILQVEVVVRAIDIGGDNGGEHAPVFLMVSLVGHIDHTLCMRIGGVREVWRSIVHHGFVDGEGSLVGKDAGGQTRHQFLDAKLVRQLDHVLVHRHIVVEELHWVLLVFKKPTHKGRQVNHVRWFVGLKQQSRLPQVPQITIFAAQPNPFFVTLPLFTNHLLHGTAHKSRRPCHHHHDRFHSLGLL
jgi:hypothetical protein